MQKFIMKAGCALAVICLAQLAVAQPPAGGPGGGAPAAPRSAAIANPTYVSITMESTINKPAAEVWKRVGKFCDISEWLQFPGCMITSGKDGEVGAVRTIGKEVLVGMTELSYSYTQPVTEGQPYILYHGTMEARPLTATTSKMIYTLMWDNSTMADDAAKERDKTQRRTMFQRAVDNMKILAEGGTLPPAAARGGGKGGPGGPGGGKGGPGGGAPKGN
ncbi:MAG: SRPBCC family protein [Acidobacteriota bacterium]